MVYNNVVLQKLQETKNSNKWNVELDNVLLKLNDKCLTC
jgi:hypothetical protein